MNILFVSGEYPTRGDVGGIGFYVVAATEALAARGHSVTVLSCARSSMISDDEINGVRVHLRPFVRIRGLNRLVRDHSLNTRIHAAISTWVHAARLGLEPDAIEASDWMAEGLLFSLLKAPVVAHLHSPLRIIAEELRDQRTPSVRIADALERWSVNRAQAITAPSRLITDELEKHHWLKRPVEHIPYPIDLDAWADVAPATETDPVVISVGRLERRKGPEVLLRAAAMLQAKGVRLQLVFLGRSSGVHNGMPYGEHVKKEAADLGVSCVFAEEVTLAGLADWFQRSRVVAVPSTFETCSLVALQGAASGRPVVVSDRVGAGELLVGQEAASIFRSGDAEGLATALQPFLEDAQLASEVGATCRRLVTEACAPDVVSGRRESVYQRASRRPSWVSARLSRLVGRH